MARLWLGSVFIICLVRLCRVATQTTICPHLTFELGPGSVNCYRYVQTGTDYFAANRTCVRDGGSLAYIENTAEDQYIRDTYFTGRGSEEFWIGLNDLDSEGTFRWSDIAVTFPPVYFNWAGGTPTTGNSQSKDCVKLLSDGWRVHEGLCATSHLPFLCKMPSCQSNTLPYCIGQEPTDPTPETVSIEVIVGVIIAVVVVIVIVVLVITCALVWKFNNDAFYRYLCCCVQSKSGPAMHSLQQENQRLRHELSQHKVSVSGRFSQGMFAGELSGVPDGRGGVLPTIKQVPSFSPTIPEDRQFSIATGNPPPLVLQRSNSRVTPMSGRVLIPGLTTPTSVVPPTGVFISRDRGKIPPGRPVRQSAPVFTGRLNYVPPKPTPVTPTSKVKGEDDISDTDSDSSSSEAIKDVVKESAESATGDGNAADKNISTDHE